MKKIAGWIILIILLIIGVIGWWRFYYTYSDGNRAGFLQKFSRRGNVFKTYEGELVMSGIQSSNGMVLSPEKFYFSVDDERVAEKVRALENNKVVLHYKEKKGTLPWRGDSRYIVDSIWVSQ
jgi:hypothetical protein